MEHLEEIMLDTWLRLSGILSKENIVSDMPYNESLICNILHRKRKENPDSPITATDLCRETKMLKSQMNRTLTSMENKKLIFRNRSSEDKRKIFIELNPEQSKTYKKQQWKTICKFNELIEKIGKEKAVEALEIFELLADSAEGIFND